MPFIILLKTLSNSFFLNISTKTNIENIATQVIVIWSIINLLFQNKLVLAILYWKFNIYGFKCNINTPNTELAIVFIILLLILTLLNALNKQIELKIFVIK